MVTTLDLHSQTIGSTGSFVEKTCEVAVALGPDAILLAVGPPLSSGPEGEWTGERLTYTSTKTVRALLRRFNASIAAQGLIVLRK
jgi:hypothetical protein